MSNTLNASIGWSRRTEAASAGREAAERANVQLASSSARLAIVLGSSWFDQQRLLDGVRAVLADTPLVGCSTAGEIGPEGPTSRSCVVLLLGADEPAWSIGMGEAVDRLPRVAGQQAAYSALRDYRGGPRTGFLLFVDGMVVSQTDVVRGIQEVLGTSSLVI